MQSALERAASLLSVDASAIVQLECIFGLRHSYVRSWLINQMVLPVVVGALVLLWYTCKRARGDEQASASAYNVAFLAVFLMYVHFPRTTAAAHTQHGLTKRPRSLAVTAAARTVT